MSNFLFNRSPAPATRPQEGPSPATLAAATRDIARVQSITASAIFAMLVSKGVLSATEAAEYMGEIGRALERDVGAPVGADAGRMLASYGQALIADDG